MQRIDPKGKVVAEFDSPTLRVVRNPDGALQVLASAAPARLKDKDGKRVPLDLSLARGKGGLLRTQVSPVAVAIDDGAARATPLAELRFAEGAVLGLDLKVVPDGVKGELSPGKELKRRETKGYSPEDTANVEALAGLPTRGAPSVSYAAERGVVASLAPTPLGVKTTYTPGVFCIRVCRLSHPRVIESRATPMYHPEATADVPPPWPRP
ncbi:MAG: hypothetical protein HYR89_09115 [Actinobacteria bacterium]|nr:hypothetical protein [Actinomycetota bacterium]